MLEFLPTTIVTLAKKGTGMSARAFREAVLEAVKDGKLTKKEIDELETMREEMGLPLDVLDAIRVQAYVTAFQSVSDDADISDDEWDELEQIQDYLGLKDSEIAKSKKQLLRLRVLSEIKHGNMPIIDVALLLKPGETAYWKEAMIRKTGDGKDSGELIITSKRLIFKGSKKSIGITISQVLDIEHQPQELLIHANRQEPLELEYKEKENAPIVDNILLFVLEHAQNRE